MSTDAYLNDLKREDRDRALADHLWSIIHKEGSPGDTFTISSVVSHLPGTEERKLWWQMKCSSPSVPNYGWVEDYPAQDELDSLVENVTAACLEGCVQDK